MAKGIGFLGNMRGKLGNMVAYSLKNSNNKETQGFRVYQPNVANPQTDAQMLQRIKMTAVNNIYRALKPIIDRGFEGVEYGNKSRQKFMSYAMGRDFNGPYLFKGYTDAVPLDGVPISSGSIPAVEVTSIIGSNLVSSLNCSFDINGTSTLGEISTELIASNLDLQNGDQITVVVFYQIGSGGRIGMGCAFDSIELDVTSSVQIPDWKESLNTKVLIASPTGEEYAYFTIDGLNAENVPLGGAIIVSRAGSNNNHLRSTAVPYIDERVFTNFYNLNQLQLVVDSYRKTENNANTDWPTEATRSGAIISLPINATTGSSSTVAVTGISNATLSGTIDEESVSIPVIALACGDNVTRYLFATNAYAWQRVGRQLSMVVASGLNVAAERQVRVYSSQNSDLKAYLEQAGYVFNEGEV